MPKPNRKHSRKYSKKHSGRTKKNKTHTLSKHYGGGTLIGLDVSYDNGTLKVHRGNTTSNDFTTAYSTGKLNEEPNINIIGTLDNINYLILMYDPDAPNGIGVDNHNGVDNHIYTHWIFTQSGNNYNERKILLPYRPPKPPKGTHRYIFSVYNAKNISSTEIENLIQSNATTKLPKATNLLTHEMQFIINSNK